MDWMLIWWWKVISRKVENSHAKMLKNIIQTKCKKELKYANENVLGLCSYVYTTDLKKANKASEILETGCVAEILLCKVLWFL